MTVRGKGANAAAKGPQPLTARTAAPGVPARADHNADSGVGVSASEAVKPSRAKSRRQRANKARVPPSSRKLPRTSSKRASGDSRLTHGVYCVASRASRSSANCSRCGWRGSTPNCGAKA